MLTIYGERFFIAEPKVRVFLTLHTVRQVRITRIRIDGSDSSRSHCRVREVKHFDMTMLTAGAPSTGGDEFVNVATLENTPFSQPLRAGERLTVEIETWAPDVDVCLVADVEMEP